MPGTAEGPGALLDEQAVIETNNTKLARLGLNETFMARSPLRQAAHQFAIQMISKAPNRPDCAMALWYSAEK
jgi:hypothetical protein